MLSSVTAGATWNNMLPHLKQSQFVFRRMDGLTDCPLWVQEMLVDIVDITDIVERDTSKDRIKWILDNHNKKIMINKLLLAIGSFHDVLDKLMYHWHLYLYKSYCNVHVLSILYQ